MRGESEKVLGAHMTCSCTGRRDNYGAAEYQARYFVERSTTRIETPPRYSSICGEQRRHYGDATGEFARADYAEIRAEYNGIWLSQCMDNL